MICLIMAGGAGTRFWPLSKKNLPKQYLNISGEKSLIRQTYERIDNFVKTEDVYVVTTEDQIDLVQQHIPELPMENIIIEPFGKNTAPCIGLSSAYLKNKYAKDKLVLTVPADHIIENTEEFQKTVKKASVAARKGQLVTFGIVPTYPATGYGYIESGYIYEKGMFHVKQFKEKPDQKTAQLFIDQRNFYWNSGIFLWSLGTILKSFETFLPEVNSIMSEINALWKDKGYHVSIDDLYAKMPKIPIDIGIMEKATQRVVIPVEMGWSDVGSWQALYDISMKDNNLTHSKTNYKSINSSSNFIYCNKLVSLIDIKDLVVVETDQVLFICPKSSSEKVKEMVQLLDNENMEDFT